MLEPQDRVDFMDVLIALFRKIEAGQVRTGFAWADFPGNPVMSIVNAVNLFSLRRANGKSQTMDVEMDLSDSVSSPLAATQSFSPEERTREMRGRSRESKSIAVPKSAPTIRKSSQSPVKRANLIDAVNELQLSGNRKPAN